MHVSIPSAKARLLPMLAISVTTALALFLWEGAKGLNLWDEGFLWYGVQRVMHGEVPLRDFQAYDPFRYYWSAALMGLWGGDTGMLGLRASDAVLQVIGLFCGLLVIARGARPDRNRLYLATASIALAVWMIPHFKMADMCASILLIGALTMLIEAPTARRYVLAGVCVGFSAFMGRNHGMYGLAASGAAILWLNLHRTQGPAFVRAALLFAAGVALGFLPVVAMLLLIPGFASAYWEGIRFLFEIKATNIGLPVPWPWRADFSGPVATIVRDVMLGVFFIATLVFGIVALIWVVWSRWQRKPVVPAFAASAFLALPYAHYAFSRADFYHLAFGIFPLLVGCFALALAKPGARTRWGVVGALLAASVLTMYGYHAGWQCRSAERCVDVEVSTSRMRVDPATAKEVDVLRRIARQYAAGGRNFVAAPLWPGAYALLDQKSPVWEIYALFPPPRRVRGGGNRANQGRRSGLCADLRPGTRWRRTVALQELASADLPVLCRQLPARAQSAEARTRALRCQGQPGAGQQARIPAEECRGARQAGRRCRKDAHPELGTALGTCWYGAERPAGRQRRHLGAGRRRGRHR